MLHDLILNTNKKNFKKPWPTAGQGVTPPDEATQKPVALVHWSTGPLTAIPSPSQAMKKTATTTSADPVKPLCY